MNKSYYRSFILERKKFLNLSAICRECGVSQPNLSQFLKDPMFDMFMSIENLVKICDFISGL